MRALGVLAEFGGYRGDWWGYGGDGGGWMWIFGPIMLIFWVAIIAVVVWLVGRATRTREPSPLDRAKEILAERYARGELSTEEYRERLDNLR